jgi:DNA replication protein DnaC
VRELAHGEFIKGRENVLLIGNSGTDKTHLATALAFAACQMGFKIRFFGVTGLVTQLLERREERQLDRFFKQLERLDLLVLDELGYVPFSASASRCRPTSCVPASKDLPSGGLFREQFDVASRGGLRFDGP